MSCGGERLGLKEKGTEHAGPVRVAVFDDTCGNLIQLVEMAEGR
jgi:hypothetical protein